MQETIDNVTEAAKVFDAALRQSVKECMTDDNVISIPRLLSQPSSEEVLFAILHPLRFSSAQIVQISRHLTAQTGRQWQSATHTLAIDRNHLVIAENSQLPDILPEMKIPETGTYIYNVRTKETKLCVSITHRSTDFLPSKELYCVTLDADKVEFPLTLRGVRQGDAFVPFGMRGSKLISDYLTDRKRNIFQRKSQLLIEDASGTIHWLIGERTSQLSACMKDTINILSLRFINE